VNIRRLSGLLKELKKIFRRRRKLGLNFAFLVIVIGAAGLAILPEQTDSADQVRMDRLRDKAVEAWVDSPSDAEKRDELAVYLQSHEVKRNVDVYTIYICGEEKQSYGQLTSAQILDLMNQHEKWLVDEIDDRTITFYEYVEDLSEQCKQSAYIGIDTMDHLTLFEGLPSADNAIRTFFQIDVESLKTSLPQETIDSLYNGIRVRDMAEYYNVISTFSQFAVDDSETADAEAVDTVSAD
jgi:forespore regulator of the sigma-K checkpoint